MTNHSYTPQGVCSRNITFDLDEGRIRNLRFAGGCNGNLKAIGRLVEGREAAGVADILRGNICNGRGTSCADQLSRAIDEALKQAV